MYIFSGATGGGISVENQIGGVKKDLQDIYISHAYMRDQIWGMF
jgi:hypothetical protein